MQTQADPTARTFRSALVGFCNDCRLYTDPLEGECPSMHDTPNGRARHQVKRRFLVCSVCRMGAATKQEAEEHNCNDFDY